MKTLRCIILMIFLVINFSIATKAEDYSEIYAEQFHLSGADKISENIPKESKKYLEILGITGSDWKEITNLNPERILSGIMKIISEKISSPFRAFLPTIAILLLCVIFKNAYPDEKNKEMSKILGSAANLSVCVSVIAPVSNAILYVCVIIKTAANFIICLVPIMSTIMMASGKPISATTHHAFIIFAGQIISRLSEEFFIPIMNILLGISVVSSVCPYLKLDGICKNIEKILKIAFKFSCAIFTSILTLQQLISNSADSLKSSVTKCMIGQCVPIVGSVVSDAYEAVQGSLRLLKSGVGVFGIISGLVIFLPAVLECFFWIIFLNFSVCISDIMKEKKISSLMKSVSNVMAITMAILIFSIVILIVSCGVTLVLGGR